MIGAIVAAFVLFVVIKSRQGGYDLSDNGFGANGYGSHSPDGYPLGGALIIEIVLTALLVFTVLSATDRIANVAFAGIPIGLVLTLIHLVGIPVDNTSVNPARSLGPALFVGGWALGAALALHRRTGHRCGCRRRVARLPVHGRCANPGGGVGGRRGAEPDLTSAPGRALGWRWQVVSTQASCARSSRSGGSCSSSGRGG